MSISMTLVDEVRRSYENGDCRRLFRRSRDRIDGSPIKRVTRDAAVLLALFRPPAPSTCHSLPFASVLSFALGSFRWPA